ncbi:hypothetical protein QNM99_16065 [Pseudomonas sp. PCH446]
MVEPLAQLPEKLLQPLQETLPWAFICSLSCCLTWCITTPRLPADNRATLSRAASNASDQGRWNQERNVWRAGISEYPKIYQ